MTDMSELARAAVPETVTREALFEALRAALVKHMRGIDGLLAARVAYSGGGDSANENDYWLRWVLPAVPAVDTSGNSQAETGGSASSANGGQQLLLSPARAEWGSARDSRVLKESFLAPEGRDVYASGVVTFTVTPGQRTVEDVLDQLLELAWYRAGVTAWWNDEGGSGDLTVDVASGSVELSHGERVTSEIVTLRRFPAIDQASLSRVEGFLGAYDEADSAPAELLADLLHLCEARGLVFEDVLKRARSYARADTRIEAADGSPCFG
jgi:hypothetical protein